MGITREVREAARRLAGGVIAKGFRPCAIHEYQDADGSPVYWRIRAKHADGEKWIRPMYVNGNGYEMGEPKFTGGKLLYRLPELLASDGAVFVVEGENCVDALAKVGVIATTSGAADSAPGADWAPLRGRDVIVWPDNDEAGAKYADVVVDALADLAADVRVLDVDALDLPRKGDAVDWLAAHPDAIADDVVGLADAAGEADDRSSTNSHTASVERMPLRREPPAAEPFPLDALGPVLGDAARVVTNALRCPPGLAGQSILAAATLAAQAHGNVAIDGRVRPVSCFFITIAETGERKSAADDLALAPHEKRERELRLAWVDAIADHRVEHAAWKKATDKAINKAGTVAQRKRAALDVGAEPKAPPEPLLRVEEPTYEAMARAYGRGWPTMGLFSDEGGRFLSGHAMSADQAIKTAAGLSKLWDSGRLTRSRASEDAAVVRFCVRLSMHLMVQPVVAPRLFADEELRGQGLVSRILAAWPDSTIGTRAYQPIDVTTSHEYRRYTAVLSELLEMPFNTDESGDLMLRSLEPVPGARAAWVKFHDHVERNLAEGGAYASVRGLGAKAAEHALRLAGVLALVADPSSSVICVEHVEAGIALARYYLTEAIRIDAVGKVAPELMLAERVLAWAGERGGKFAMTTLLQLGPRGVRDKESAERVLRVLEAHGQIRKLPEGVTVDGKPRRQAWQVVTDDA